MIEMVDGVGNPDLDMQIVLVNKKCSWMLDLGNSLECVALYHRIGGGLLFKVLEVKKSEIERGGWGLFACCDFTVCIWEPSLTQQITASN